MSKPILPVTIASSSPSSYNDPTESRWGIRSIAIILGVSLIGLLALEIYRRSRANPSSDSKAPTSLQDISINRTFEGLPTRFSLEKQHSSQLTHNGLPCLNEAKPLFFKKFAEGWIMLRVNDLVKTSSQSNRSQISSSADVTVDYYCRGEKFFAYKGKADHTQAAILKFFIPNLPYQERIHLEITVVDPNYRISTDDKNKNTIITTVPLEVQRESADYCVGGRESWLGFPDLRMIRRYSLSTPIPIDNSSSFDIDFKKNKVEIHPPTLSSKNITFSDHSGSPSSRNITLSNYSGSPAVAYLKLVSPDTGHEKDVAIVLPFPLRSWSHRDTDDGVFLSSDLIELWRHTYIQVTKKNPKADLKLVLTDIQLTSYIRLEPTPPDQTT